MRRLRPTRPGWAASRLRRARTGDRLARLAVRPVCPLTAPGAALRPRKLLLPYLCLCIAAFLRRVQGRHGRQPRPLAAPTVVGLLQVQLREGRESAGPCPRVWQCAAELVGPKHPAAGGARACAPSSSNAGPAFGAWAPQLRCGGRAERELSADAGSHAGCPRPGHVVPSHRLSRKWNASGLLHVSGSVPPSVNPPVPYCPRFLHGAKHARAHRRQALHR